MSLDTPRGTAEVARRLAQLLARAPGDAPRLAALDPARPPARVAAVDGSSVVLAESGNHLLAAFRAGAVTLDAAPTGGNRRAPPAASILEPEVVLLTPADARALVVSRLEALGAPTADVPRLDPKGALDALRSLEEARAALDAVETLGAGDMLLIDGALQARPSAPLLARALERAAERDVDVVGVCKSTSLVLGGAPALVVCQLEARHFAARTWFAALPTPPAVRGASFAARLSPAEERVFRFDVASATRAPGEVLARVASLCGHPAYPGYPSPLAMAHNAVLLNDETRRRLLLEVHEAALDAGVDPRAWDAAFIDYHDVLEIGA